MVKLISSALAFMPPGITACLLSTRHLVGMLGQHNTILHFSIILYPQHIATFPSFSSSEVGLPNAETFQSKALDMAVVMQASHLAFGGLRLKDALEFEATVSYIVTPSVK